jgi:peptidoglycan/LPS O-acetylase OafA/YrhL
MKNHLEALDGIRGIAALSVLLYHLGHWLHAPLLAANSGFAVDLFFCLSGYVLPLAYWSRRETISTVDFCRLRVIRLMPLIVIGGLISCAYVVLKVRASHLPVSSGELALVAAGAVLDIPTAGAPHDIGGPMVFPLNGPQYTLFLEFVANIIWWSLRRHSQRWLIVAAILVGAGCVAAFGFGGDTEQNFLLGFPRVGLSFAVGLALYHLRHRYDPTTAANALLFTVAGAMTLALFYYPFAPSIWVELGWVVAVAPALVMAGTRLALPPGVAKASLWLGSLSYPIYALHYPIFCWVNGAYRSRFGAQSMSVEIPLAFALVVAGSYVALMAYDQPVRRWLTSVARSG